MKPQNFSELKNRLEQIEQEFKSTKTSGSQFSLCAIEKDLTLNLNWKDQLPSKKFRETLLESNSLNSACQSLERSMNAIFGLGAFTALYELGSISQANAIPTIVALSSTLKSFLNQSTKFENISIEEVRVQLTSESGGSLKIKLETDARELSQFIQTSQKYFSQLKTRSKLIQTFDLTSFQDNEAGFLNIQFSFNLDVLSDKSQASVTRIDV